MIFLWEIIKSPVTRWFIAVFVAGALGWHARARLDESHNLRAQVYQLQQNIKNTDAVAAASTQRELAAAAQASTLERKVHNYATLLRKRPTPHVCRASRFDARRMSQF